MKKFAQTIKEARMIEKDRFPHGNTDENIFCLSKTTQPKKTLKRRFFIGTHGEFLNL